MAGYDDPRYLQQVIEALTLRVKALEGNTLPFAANQKGALPGTMRAVAINDRGQSGSMWINFTNAGPGLGPYLAVTDSSGVIRVELGNLAANGISPAQFGFRSNNASGTPIFDSLGLIAVMQLIASSQSQSYISATLSGPGTGTGISGTGGEVTIASTGNFTLSRQANVLLIGTCAAAGWTTTGIVPLIAPIYIRVPGQANSASGTVHHSGVAGSTTDPTSATPVQVLTLPAGTYSASLLWNSVSGNERLDVYAYNLFVFLLGS